jgi:hypothetical protein
MWTINTSFSFRAVEIDGHFGPVPTCLLSHANDAEALISPAAVVYLCEEIGRGFADMHS